MDSELFAAIVKDSLLEHGSVAIPDFGKFTLVDMPASFSDRGFTINPPYRKVVFAAGHFEDDGYVVGTYSKFNALDDAVASGLLNSFVGKMKSEIVLSGACAIPGFGKLKSTRSGEVFFIEDEELKICPHLDSLQPVSLKSRTFSAPETNETPVAPEMPAAAEETPATKSGHRLSPLYAVLVSALVAAAVFFALLYVLGRTCPDIVDPFLYSAEEMAIIRTPIP